MSVYIDVNETLKRIQTDYNNSDMNEDWGKGVNFAISRILRQPIADVQPVVRGEWTELYEDNYKCSACGAWWTLLEGTPQDNEMNFCPVCGAKMVEE